MRLKEITTQPPAPVPEYFIYLITYWVTKIKTIQVWIKQDLYQTNTENVTGKPVIISNDFYNDTLVQYTHENIWQINITGKLQKKIKPTKDIASLVAANDLVVKLSDNGGKYYTRHIKHIIQLESTRGQ